MLFSRKVLDEAAADEGYWVKLFQRLFSSEDGKKALIYLFEKSGFFDISLDTNAENLLVGKRAFMLEILNLISVDPKDLISAGKDESMQFLEEVLSKEELR